MDTDANKPGEVPVEANQHAANHEESNALAQNVSIESASNNPEEWILNVDVVSKTPNPAKLIFEIDQPMAPYALSDDPNVKCSVETFPLPSTSHADKSVLFDVNDPINNAANNDSPVEGKKRRRHSSDDDRSNVLPPFKAAKLDCKTNKESKKHHVTFLFTPPFQKDNTEAASAQPQQGPAAEKQVLDDQPPPPNKRVQLLPAAEPMWLAARRHRGAEQKAKLRADFNQELLEKDIIPSSFLGSEKMPRYFIKDGALPLQMKDLIVQQGRDKAILAIEVLREEQSKEKRLADYYDGICADLYKSEGHPGLTEAMNLMSSLLTHYRGVEKRRLDSLLKREESKQPTSDEDFARLLCKDPEPFTVPNTRGSGPPRRGRPAKTPSPTRKRKSSVQPSTSSKGKQGKQTPPNKPQPRSRSKSPKSRGPQRKGIKGQGDHHQEAKQGPC